MDKNTLIVLGFLLLCIFLSLDKKEGFATINVSEFEEQTTINYTCPKCGQNQYFCQCKNNVKSMFKYFNPEKDIY